MGAGVASANPDFVAVMELLLDGNAILVESDFHRNWILRSISDRITAGIELPFGTG
jgi:hypothetical protein